MYGSDCVRMWTKQMRVQRKSADDIVQAVYRGLDLFTAVLLLTDQIRIGAVFVTHEGFGLSLSGPFTGSGAEPRTPQAELVLDGLDVVTALLLVLDQIHVIGSFITVNRATIVVSGPPFGQPDTAAYFPHSSEFFQDFRGEIRKKFNSI